MWHRGDRIADIAEAFGCSAPAVSKCAVALGLRRNVRRRMRAMTDETATWRSIGSLARGTWWRGQDMQAMTQSARAWHSTRTWSRSCSGR